MQSFLGFIEVIWTTSFDKRHSARNSKRPKVILGSNEGLAAMNVDYDKLKKKLVSLWMFKLFVSQ
jgi:hypothetical protein